jgi:uncharacterized protein (TIGR03437 family)
MLVRFPAACFLIACCLLAPLAMAETPLSVQAVVNSASMIAGPLAPGTLAAVKGSGFSDDEITASANGTQELPKKLGGAQVFFNGMALPILSVSPTEVQFQLPYHLGGISAGTIYVRSERADGGAELSKGTPIEIQAAAPGIYAFGGEEPRGGLILHSQANGSSPAGAPVTTANPAHAGETLLVWATGLGDVENGAAKAGLPLNAADAPIANAVEAGVDGRAVAVISSVLPQGAVGVYEVRIQLPDDVSSDPKAQLSLLENGHASNTVLFPLQASSSR